MNTQTTSNFYGRTDITTHAIDTDAKTTSRIRRMERGLVAVKRDGLNAAIQMEDYR